MTFCVLTSPQAIAVRAAPDVPLGAALATETALAAVFAPAAGAALVVATVLLELPHAASSAVAPVAANRRSRVRRENRAINSAPFRIAPPRVQNAIGMLPKSPDCLRRDLLSSLSGNSIV
jgi:hypothetical protein